MLRKIETGACVKQSRESCQQGDFGECHKIDMTLQEIGNHVRVAARDCPKSGERERGGRCGNNHKEEPEGPEIAFSAPLDVIESHSPWSNEQHSHQRNGASIHMENNVNQIAGNLM